MNGGEEGILGAMLLVPVTAWRSTSIDDITETVRKVGPEHYVLASDLDQVHNPAPPEVLRIYINPLLEREFDSEEIRVMVKDNPEKVLGLYSDLRNFVACNTTVMMWGSTYLS
jgi:microsomal dipeptidase-like Zn-dependent dipeptidase